MDKTLEFGQFVKAKRLENKQTISEVSHLSGISTSQISRIEKGQRGIPKPPMLMRLSKGIRTPYEELMEKAGYLKNVPHNELEAVKSFFESHRIADEKIEDCLKNLMSEGYKKEIIKSLMRIIEKYVTKEEIEEEDIEYTHRGLFNFIDRVDLEVSDKLNLINDLTDLKYSMQYTQMKIGNCIEINDLDQYNFTLDGVVLDVETQNQLKSVLRVVLKV